MFKKPIILLIYHLHEILDLIYSPQRFSSFLCGHEEAPLSRNWYWHILKINYFRSYRVSSIDDTAVKFDIPVALWWFRNVILLIVKLRRYEKLHILVLKFLAMLPVYYEVTPGFCLKHSNLPHTDAPARACACMELLSGLTLIVSSNNFGQSFLKLKDRTRTGKLTASRELKAVLIT
jgi:4-amino-4-deoxy-L-arabinose transferase-like glycosyltransferase